MSNLIQVINANKSYGTRVLFDQGQFAINEGEHVGVIGPNGAGKTTLFRILTGQEDFDSGDTTKSKSLRLGYLAQHDNWSEKLTVEEYLTQDCITPIWDLKAMGKKLGLSDEMFTRPIVSLSGGYRMRCKLLYLIGQEPNLMLLDEPTNYLDLETTLVLEEFLQSYQGAFLLISHDREFLRRTTDHILEIEQGQITKFNGNLDDYFEQKQMLRTQLESRAMGLAEKRKSILDFVARFGAKATKAKQAQSRLKSLARMETIELKPLPITSRIQIPEPTRIGKMIIKMSDVSLGYGDRTILKNVDFELKGGDHVSVVGLNGAGKSTFLKGLAQSLKPSQGKTELGYEVSIGYYAQHVAESLDLNGTVLTEMMAKAHPSVTPKEAQNLAGSLLFSGDDSKKKISVLSGGERSRVALGQILLQKVSCLILDEPTNHLDFQTVEALTQALEQYPGTVVVVSHDRSFVRRVGRKIVEINHGQVMLFLGTYDEYVWSIQKGVLSQREVGISVEPQKSVQTPVEKINFKEEKKRLERDLRFHKKRISEIDPLLKDLNLKIAQLNSDIAKGQIHLVSDFTKVQIEIEHLEEQWLKHTEQVDLLEKSISKL